MQPDPIISAVLGMDAWLETMRSERGYTGPVAHRWQDSLIYAGPSSDWRYEGIVSGYLRLYETSGDDRWLWKAKRAGEDIVASKIQSDNYFPSSFEENPSPGGTPHEAACDLALFRLAKVLRIRGEPSWEGFAGAAEHNLRGYYLVELWDDRRRAFLNLPHDPSIVPNKVATVVEALLELADLRGDGTLYEQFIEPALESILVCQVSDPGSPLQGAIDQSSNGGKLSGRYFPFYIARCVPALLRGYQLSAAQRYLDAAVSAMSFVLRCQREDGSFPQVLFANQRMTIYPQWIAGCGDILRAAYLLEPYGFGWLTLEQTERWLLAGMLPSGGIRTGRGFSLLEGRPKTGLLPDLRDILPVCGWVDKAFYYLSLKISQDWVSVPVNAKEAEMECLYRGQRALYHETRVVIDVLKGAGTLYHWEKGQPWAAIL